MNDLSFLFEEILNENPNQAIKFLKSKGLDPTTTPRGKTILDFINGITKGDGYTYLLTKFHLQDRLPGDEIQKLHQFLKTNKNLLIRLPQPVVNYENYRTLRNDIDNLHGNLILKKLYNQISEKLRTQAIKLPIIKQQELKSLASKFDLLKPEKQRHFMKTVFGYTDINVFMENLKRYIFDVESGNDYETTKQKILSTPGAYLAYDFEDQNILIAHIYTFDASKTLGCTSSWCITRDISRFRQYKTGKNYYFFIWDYKYPSNDSNFFIATAYDSVNPASSQTHEHIDDKKLDFNDVIESKNLSYEIFNEYIKQFKEKLKTSFIIDSPIARALNENNVNDLINFIENSRKINEIEKRETPSTNYSNTRIYIGIEYNDLKELLEIGDEFEYIRTMASSYYNQGGNYDESDVDYIHAFLNKDNLNLVIDLAKKLGVSKEIYNKFTEEGNLSKFFENYGMNDITTDLLYAYEQAQDDAESRAAKELISEIPFDVEDVAFDINEMFEYYVNNELTAKDFDELIEQISEKLPYFSYDTISESRYTDVDLDELNSDFKRWITNIMEKLEDDEDHPYFKAAQKVRMSKDILEKLGFKFEIGDNKLATWGGKNIRINILDTELDEDDEGNEKLIITAEIIRYGLEKNKRTIKSKQKIRIPSTSLPNYMYHYQMDIQERLNLGNLIKKS